MKKSLLSLLGSLALCLAAYADTTYEWTGGAAGYGGFITLNSSSSANGSLADIVYAEVTTPNATFVFNPADVYRFETFTWNPFQITDMHIEWYVSDGVVGFGQNYGGTGFNFAGSNTNSGGYLIDQSGSWIATNSVPDGSATLGLFSLALIVLVSMRRKLCLN